LVVRERVNEAQHELVADDPRRVVDAVEACDLAHRVLDRLRDAVEARVDRVDEPPLDQRARGPSVPDPPERLRPGLDEHDGDDRRLARLDERQELEGLVHRAVAAREERDRARLLHEEELAREEVLERDELRVGGDPRVRLLLERQPDVEPEALLAAGARHARDGEELEGQGIGGVVLELVAMRFGHVFEYTVTAPRFRILTPSPPAPQLVGFCARTKALMNLPSTSDAMASPSRPAPA